MLNKIIENELYEFMQDPKRQKDKEVSKANKDMSELLTSLQKKDKSLGMKFDEVIAQEEAAIGAMYFREGFKTALKLINEIYGGALC